MRVCILILFVSILIIGCTSEAPNNSVVTNSTAKGMAHGANFKVEKATLQNGILKLRQGKDFFADHQFIIFIFLKKGDTVDGKKYNVKSDGKKFRNPHIHFSYKVPGKKLPKTEIFMSGYDMTLEFGTVSEGKVSGKISLHLPDKAKSYVEGSFEAEVK